MLLNDDLLCSRETRSVPLFVVLYLEIPLVSNKNEVVLAEGEAACLKSLIERLILILFYIVLPLPKLSLNHQSLVIAL